MEEHLDADATTPAQLWEVLLRDRGRGSWAPFEHYGKVVIYHDPFLRPALVPSGTGRL